MRHIPPNAQWRCTSGWCFSRGQSPLPADGTPRAPARRGESGSSPFPGPEERKKLASKQVPPTARPTRPNHPGLGASRALAALLPVASDTKR